MKVIAIATLVVPGKDGNVEVPPGASTELPEADARDLIARGFAAAAAGAKPANPGKPGPSDPLAPILDGTIPEITAKLEALNLDELQRLRALEDGGKTRKGVLAAIDEAIKALAPEGGDGQGEGDGSDAGAGAGGDGEAEQAEQAE
jgi:hypothetical protein